MKALVSSALLPAAADVCQLRATMLSGKPVFEQGFSLRRPFNSAGLGELVLKSKS